MFIRGSRLKVPADRIDEMVTYFTEKVVPEAKKQDGNRGAILLIDRSNEVGWGLTYWDTEAALKSSEYVGTSLRTAAAAAVGATIEEVDRLEIVVQERAAPPAAGTFVRVNDAQGDPARIDDAIQYMRESALPVVRALKGFRALIFAVNRQSGRGVISSVWETLDDLKASESAIAPLREQAASAAGTTTMKVEIYESAYAELSQPVTSS